MRTIALDGSPGGVDALVDALAAALDGGPAVLPHTGPAPATPGPPPATAVVIATSGSTGRPRHVALTAAALRASAGATAARLGGPARWLLALPAEHVAGVQVIVRALLAGAPPAVQDLRPGFRADAFAAVTDGLGPGPRHTSLVPTQLLRLLDAGGPALDALRSYRAVLVGGAALDADLRRRALDAGVAVVTTYGMSETAGGCVYDGVPLDGVTVDLEADGRIVLGGPTLATGYLGGPPFGGRFRTGDLGRLVGGRLEVLGRADDVIVTGGENVAPAAVERVLVAQPGVRAACVVGIPDVRWGQVVAAAVVPGPGRPGDDGLRDAVRAALGRAAVPRRIVDVAEIPVRGIGKPDRAAVTRLVTVTGGLEPPSG
ncbi:O-succinylbenzoic acid--CoA ligase [Pseudonocardia hydrocarbonoxydans]|uniref:O-succinylbenzoic acid--CoA ligase n=1 Tax=Pseudonocardia hydrocarbonoxydans TaxID=76726 RepID=A0A4Y3WPI4_9PSEU|nr:o-succinylbenzoate--CoA ligase [Pseudonocardia hydrocarbonoxydans]GEC20773.1 O-succinylbenzoic acid--CoA ligase [Pseudonocardia hydrocarbonoxydans]